ncbi:MAG: CIA30 family protein [Anderseniella sp.]
MTPIQTNWQLITDQVMGGVSSGTVIEKTIDGQNAHLMTGRVSLDNNGGFIQMATDISPPPIHAIGIAMMLKGNGETYNIHLRTTDLTRPWQSYRHTFTAPEQWTLCHFAFTNFEAHRTTAALRLSGIRRIGIVAIGRVFNADVSVGEVSYYNAQP